MILRVSAAFAKQYKCLVSQVGENVPQYRRLDAWSCHFIRVRRKPLVVVMNDATLYTLILPATGLKGFPDIWLKLLGRIGEVWTRHGVAFDPDNQAVILLSRTNRSLIGSMNDAIMLIRIYDDDARNEKAELDLEEMEARSNRTPYKALGFEQPERLMACHGLRRDATAIWGEQRRIEVLQCPSAGGEGVENRLRHIAPHGFLPAGRAG